MQMHLPPSGQPLSIHLSLDRPSSHVLRLENVTKTYHADGEEVHALDGVSLDPQAITNSSSLASTKGKF